MSALPRPVLAPGPQKLLNDALHDLHHRAGWPSLRTLARDTGVSHTTVSKVMSAPALPSWGTLELLVEAMDGDTPRFHDLWLAASTPTDGARPHPTRIAGRRDELEAVRRHLETGTGLLLVTGEAGMGKTTVVTTAAAGVDVVVATGHCLPLSTGVPLMPVVDALRAVHDHAGVHWYEAVAGLPPLVRHHLSRLLPDIDPATTELDDIELGGLPPILVVSQTLAALARTSPLGLVVEDLHWADAATLDWLEHYLTTDAGVPLVGTWRSEDIDTSARHDDWLDRVRRLPCVHDIRLTPLSGEETAAQVRLLDPGVEDSRVGRIHERSRGHPLFTEQLARGTDAADLLPEALAVALDRRLARLTGPALDVVRTLGVADRPLAVPILERATGLASASLLAGLRDLDTSHLIRGSPTGEVTLAHPLLAEAARLRLAPGEAPVLHAALADSLAGSGDASPGELAVHWRAARRPDQEIDCRIAAAHLARERLAYREELASWLRALELYDSGVVTAEVELWDLLRRAMSAAYEAGDAGKAVPLMHRALALDLPDVARVHVLQASGEVLYDAGDQRSAMKLLDESHDLVLRLSPDAELVSVVAARFWSLVTVGQVHAALREAGQALAHLSTLDDPRLDRFRRSHGIVDRVERGAFTSALALAEEQGRAAHGRDLWLELMAAASAVDVLLHTSEPPQRASDIAGRALLAAQPWHVDDSWPVALLRSNVSWAHLRAGDTSSAGAVLEPSTRSDPSILTWTAHVCMAAVELRRGEVDRALSHSRAVQAQMVNHDVTWVELVPLDAEVALWAGEVDSAVALLERAMDVVLTVDAARRAGDVLVLLARAVADSVGQTTDQGQRATAHDELVRWRSRCAVDPLGPRAVAVATPVLRTQWKCELARILGRGTADLWDRAASGWGRLHRPHDAAYCRWRAAQCALREGRGTLAARLLTRAASDAREHVPLSEAIAATARAGS